MAGPEVRFQDVRVDRAMTRAPASIEPEATLSDAAETMLRGGFRHLPVVDGTGRLVGMVSERDLRTRLGTPIADYGEATLEALSEPVSEVMSPDPISIAPATTLAEALEVFADERVGALAVVDEADQLLGILSYVDLLAYIRERGGAPPKPMPADFEEPPEEGAEAAAAPAPGPAAGVATARPGVKRPKAQGPAGKAARRSAAKRPAKRMAKRTAAKRRRAPGKGPRAAAGRGRAARKAPRRRGR